METLTKLKKEAHQILVKFFVNIFGSFFFVLNFRLANALEPIPFSISFASVVDKHYFDSRRERLG